MILAHPIPKVIFKISKKGDYLQTTFITCIALKISNFGRGSCTTYSFVNSSRETLQINKHCTVPVVNNILLYICEDYLSQQIKSLQSIDKVFSIRSQELWPKRCSTKKKISKKAHCVFFLSFWHNHTYLILCSFYNYELTVDIDIIH